MAYEHNDQTRRETARRAARAEIAPLRLPVQAKVKNLGFRRLYAYTIGFSGPAWGDLIAACVDGKSVARSRVTPFVVGRRTRTS